MLRKTEMRERLAYRLGWNDKGSGWSTAYAGDIWERLAYRLGWNDQGSGWSTAYAGDKIGAVGLPLRLEQRQVLSFTALQPTDRIKYAFIFG